MLLLRTYGKRAPFVRSQLTNHAIAVMRNSARVIFTNVRNVRFHFAGNALICTTMKATGLILIPLARCPTPHPGALEVNVPPRRAICRKLKEKQLSHLAETQP